MTTPLRPAERAYSLSTRSGWEQFVTAPPRQRPDLLAAAQVRGLPAQARAEYEEQRSVWHANLGPLRTPQMRTVCEDLDDIVEANRQDGDKVKGAAVIDAFPGLGKSTIAQVFAPGTRPAGERHNESDGLRRETQPPHVAGAASVGRRRGWVAVRRNGRGSIRRPHGSIRSRTQYGGPDGPRHPGVLCQE